MTWLKRHVVDVVAVLVFVGLWVPVVGAVWMESQRDTLTNSVIQGSGELADNAAALQLSCNVALMEARTVIKKLSLQRKP